MKAIWGEEKFKFFQWKVFTALWILKLEIQRRNSLMIVWSLQSSQIESLNSESDLEPKENEKIFKKTTQFSKALQWTVFIELIEQFNQKKRTPQL